MLLKPSLEFLDLGVQLPAQGLLVLDFAVEGAVLLFFALQNLAHLDLVPFKVGDGLLCELQVAFHLPLELLDVSLLLLLALPRVLDLVETFLQPDLQLVEVVALVVKGLDLLLLLHLALCDRFLLLVELVDQLLLVEALLLHLLDLGVLVCLLVLHLGQPALALSHLPPKRSLACLRLFQCLLKALNLLIFLVDFCIQGVDLLLKTTLDIFKFGYLAQKILFGIGATSEGDLNLIHFRSELSMFLLGHLPLSNHLIQMVLSKLDLFSQLLLELLKVARLEARLESQPERPPKPGLANHVASDCSLRNKQSHLVLP